MELQVPVMRSLTCIRTFVASAVVLVLASGIAIHQIYHHTRSAYRAVGENDGSISARWAMIQRLRALGVVEECNGQPLGTQRSEFVTAKAISVYVTVERDVARFCEFPVP